MHTQRRYATCPQGMSKKMKEKKKINFFYTKKERKSEEKKIAPIQRKKETRGR